MAIGMESMLENIVMNDGMTASMLIGMMYICAAL